MTTLQLHFKYTLSPGGYEYGDVPECFTPEANQALGGNKRKPGTSRKGNTTSNIFNDWHDRALTKQKQKRGSCTHCKNIKLTLSRHCLIRVDTSPTMLHECANTTLRLTLHCIHICVTLF
jgi:hypothetical protein